MLRIITVTLFVVVLSSAYVSAVPVDPTAPDGIAALYLADGQYYLLKTNGDMWIFKVVSGVVTCISGNTEEGPGLPVPLSQIRDWTWMRVITWDNRLWYWAGSPVASWHSGIIPCLDSPVPTGNSTFGAIKEKFRQGDED